jgi:pyridoxamine 5'-phosphate oxidase family protein
MSASAGAQARSGHRSLTQAARQRLRRCAKRRLSGSRGRPPTQHQHPRAARPQRCLRQQPRFSNPGLSRQYERGPTAVATFNGSTLEHTTLGIPGNERPRNELHHVQMIPDCCLRVNPNPWASSSVQTTAVSVFRDAELRYLTGGRQLGRIATVGADGTPHVVPVGWIYNAASDTIDIGGHELERTKKFRDVARTGRAAIVIDDLESTDPWRPRGVEIRGRAEAIALPTPLIRIHPERIVSWGLEGGRSARTVAS